MTLRITTTNVLKGVSTSPLGTSGILNLLSPDIVNSNNAIKTIHSGDGSNTTVSLYVWNDGNRDQLDSKGNTVQMPLTYKSITVVVKGVTTQIQTGVPNYKYSTTDTEIQLANASKYNKGTVLWFGTQQNTKVEKVMVNNVSGNTVSVTRAINGVSVDGPIEGSPVTADTSHVTFSADGTNFTAPDTITGHEGQLGGTGDPAFAWTPANNYYPNINDDPLTANPGGAYAGKTDLSWIAHAFYVKVHTDALPTQIKSDVYLEVTADEYPRGA